MSNAVADMIHVKLSILFRLTMAATLPAIHSPMGKQSGVHRIQSPQSKMGGAPNPIIITTHPKKRSQGRKEREMELRRSQLRAQQPTLNKKQTAQ